jgi:hypothetical protein
MMEYLLQKESFGALLQSHLRKGDSPLFSHGCPLTSD